MRPSSLLSLHRYLCCLVLLFAFAIHASLAAQTAPELPREGLRLWLRADQGVVTDADGNVQRWEDQSGRNMHATLGNISRLRLVAGAVNGQPALRFAPPETAGGQYPWLQLPNFMEGATAGEMFVVLKSSATAGASNGAWCLGSDYMSTYYNGATSYYSTEYPDSNGWVGDYFVGLSSYSPAITELGSFHIYNVSRDSSAGEMMANFQSKGTLDGATCTFTTTPIIGKNLKGTPFIGEIAEVIIYDHRLSALDRVAVHAALDARYALLPTPLEPTDLSASSPIEGGKIVLRWKRPEGVWPVFYRVERKAAGEAEFSSIALSVVPEWYCDASAVNGQLYSYRVIACVTPTRQSPPSASVAAKASAVAAEVPTAGLRLWLRSDTGVVLDENGKAKRWSDQSGWAADGDSAAYPREYFTDPSVGCSVLHDAYFDVATRLSDAVAGEMVLVGRIDDDENCGFYNAFSSNGGVWYSLGEQYSYWYDSFGSKTTVTRRPPIQDWHQYHVYSATAKGGSWANSFNFVPSFSRAVNEVSFKDGGTVSNGYGTIVEVLVYDHELSTAERLQVAQHIDSMTKVFRAPLPPTDLTGFAIWDQSGVRLCWAAGDAISSYFQVERAVHGGVFEVIADRVSSLSYVDKNAVAGVQYDYRVRSESFTGSLSAPTEPLALTNSRRPEDVPTDGLALWLRADCGVELGVRREVWAWHPYAGTVSAAVPSDDCYDLLPKHSQVSIGGQPAVSFTHNSGYYTSLSLPSCCRGAGSAEVFVVMKPRELANSSQYLYLGDFGYISIPANQGGGVYAYIGGWSGSDYTLPRLIDQPLLVHVSAEPGAWVLRVNGKELARLTDFTTFNPYWSSKLGGSVCDADLSEVIAFNRTLSDSERVGIYGYLDEKYDLSNDQVANLAPAIDTLAYVPYVRVRWNGAAAAFYKVEIERSVGTSGEFMPCATLAGGAGVYVEPDVAPEVSYTYRLRTESQLGVRSDWVTLPTVTTGARPDFLGASGLALWLRADTGVEVDPDGYIRSWRDQSGADRDAKTSEFDAYDHATVVPGAANGHPVVKTVNGEDLALARGLSGQGESFVVLRLAKRESADYEILCGCSYLSRTGKIAGSYSVAGSNGTQYRNFSLVPSVALEKFHLFNVSAGDAFVVRTNGAEQFRDGGPGCSFDYSTLSANLDIEIAEVLAFDHALTDVERRSVEKYLFERYLQVLPAPAFSPAPGAKASAYDVSLASETAGAKIYYTTDGTDPVPGVSALYSTPIHCEASTRIRAIAAKEGEFSAIANGLYSIGVGRALVTRGVALSAAISRDTTRRAHGGGSWSAVSTLVRESGVTTAGVLIPHWSVVRPMLSGRGHSWFRTRSATPLKWTPGTEGLTSG